MARYEHLPIYKKAMDLAIYVEKIVRNFSRYHKYTLGSELREKSREVVEAIISGRCRVRRLPATGQFSPSTRAIDPSKGRRYRCGKRKRWFEFPMHHSAARSSVIRQESSFQRPVRGSFATHR